jgi:hypothetical protein
MVQNLVGMRGATLVAMLAKSAFVVPVGMGVCPSEIRSQSPAKSSCAALATCAGE